MSSGRVFIVGAGIIGLATAYYILRAGTEVTLVDRDPEGDKASLGNAGGIAVTEVVPASSPKVFLRVLPWMLDPLGPLAIRPAYAFKLIPWLTRFAKASRPREVERIATALAAINSRAYDDLIPMLRETGMAGELHQVGALTVYETDSGYRHDEHEWSLKRRLGIETRELTGIEARELEPALSPSIRRAVLLPQWSHVNDPRRILSGLREWLFEHGAQIVRGEVRSVTNAQNASLRLELDTGFQLTADKVVVAAGAWSGVLASRIGDSVSLESERGYNTTIQDPKISVNREIIFAERKFVATPLSCGLRIGGAAEFGGLYARPNLKRSQALVELARRFLPELRAEGGIAWWGHRPATPDSLPVIGQSKCNARVFYAFGHGHLGLTQAATTGRLISEAVLARTPSIDLTPYSIARFS